MTRKREVLPACSFGVLLMLVSATLGAQEADRPWEGPAFAASPAALLEAVARLPAAPEGATVDYLLRRASYRFDADGRLELRRHQVYRVLTQGEVEDFAQLELEYSPWYQQKPVVRARVITADGLEHPLDPATISEAGAQVDSPTLFDDDLQLRAPLPAMAVGALVETETVVTDREPFFASGRTVSEAIFEGYYRRLEIEAHGPRELPLRTALRLLPPRGLRESSDSSQRQITYLATDHHVELKWLAGRPLDQPAFPYLALSTGASWGEVARAYSALVEEALAGHSLAAEAKKLARGARGRDEVVARLLERIQAEVRYTGVELGAAKIVPRSPAEVLKRRYGDCKDKATLLVALLRSAGIPAHVALLQVSPWREVEPNLPGLGAFNHAIVYVPGPPALWIDPTVELARVGQLPSSEAGRLALVASAATEALVQIPEPSVSENLLEVEREVFLAELGKGRLIETLRYTGESEIDSRQWLLDSGPKEIDDWFETYAESTHLSKQIVSRKLMEAKDLGRRLEFRLELAEAGRAVTDLDEALVAIRTEPLLERVPRPLRTAAKEEDDEKGEPRTIDFVLDQTHAVEWRYRIHPTPGMALRELPKGEELALGAVRFTSSFSEAAGGVVEARLRLEAGQRRLTPAEYEETRKAVTAFLEREAVVIWFDQVGPALIKEGKVVEGVKELQALVAQGPETAFHHLRLARAYLDVGLGKSAREHADRAVALGPELAKAHELRGWILQHDEVGRRFGPGWDRAGALAAYRRAVELDPSNLIAHADLVILLEHDKNGHQFSLQADLAQAVEELRVLRKKKGGADLLDVNMAFDLLGLRRYDELAELVPEIGDRANHRLFNLLSITLKEGLPAALRFARSLPTNEQRQTILAQAGQNLVRSGRYREAAGMMRLAAAGSAEAAQAAPMIERLEQLTPWKELSFEAGDPAAVPHRVLTTFFDPEKRAEIPRLVSKHVQGVPGFDGLDDLEDLIEREDDEMLAQIGLDGMLDILFAVMDVRQAGDPSWGVRLNYQPAVGPPGDSFAFYLIAEDAELKLLAVNEDLSPVGLAVLAQVEAGELEVARRWLDLALLDVADEPVADPFLEEPFRLVWPGSDEPEAERMRVAAAVLLVGSDGEPSKQHAEQALSILLAAESSASGEPRLGIDIALGRAYRALNRHGDGAALFERMHRQLPASERVVLKAWEAFGRSGRLAEFRPIAEAWSAAKPRDAKRVEMLAEVAIQLGDDETGRALIRALADEGRATQGGYNWLAWQALVRGGDRGQALKDALKAAEISSFEEPAILHTLAIAYAELNRPNEARKTLESLLAKREKKELLRHDWLVVGRMAESFGQPGLARELYERVQPGPEEDEEPLDAWQLARQRLAALDAAEAAGKKGRRGG